jgi:hypothetical protein
LGKAKGLEISRQRAELDAKAQFVRWLKGSVSVRLRTDDEAILFLEGREDNDKDALKESGKAVEKTSTKMESVARGLVRGLQLLHVEQSPRDKTYTVVYGWEAKTAEGTRRVKEINESDKKEPGEGAKGKPDSHGSDKPSKSKKAPIVDPENWTTG